MSLRSTVQLQFRRPDSRLKSNVRWADFELLQPAARGVRQSILPAPVPATSYRPQPRPYPTGPGPGHILPAPVPATSYRLQPWSHPTGPGHGPSDILPATAPALSRRRTAPTLGCTPPASQTPKRKETCAGKDMVATKAKRIRKGIRNSSKLESKGKYNKYELKTCCVPTGP